MHLKVLNFELYKILIFFVLPKSPYYSLLTRKELIMYLYKFERQFNRDCFKWGPSFLKYYKISQLELKNVYICISLKLNEPQKIIKPLKMLDVWIVLLQRNSWRGWLYVPHRTCRSPTYSNIEVTVSTISYISFDDILIHSVEVA